MTLSGLMRSGSRSSTSYTKAMPPDMPAAKLGPTDPRMTTTPPVMYSQPLEPQPSTTAMASELRTQKRSPAWPAAKSRSEEHTSELQSLMRISYAVFCFKKKHAVDGPLQAAYSDAHVT